MYRRLHGGLRHVVRRDPGDGSRCSAINPLPPGKFCLSKYRTTFHLVLYIETLLSIECLAILRWLLCRVGKIRHMVFVGKH